MLVEYFNQLIAPSPALIAWVKKELRQSHLEENERYNVSLKQLGEARRRLDNQIQVLYEDRLDGRISPEVYDRKFHEKTEERKAIISNIERLAGQNTEYIEQAVDILDLTQNAAEIFKSKSKGSYWEIYFRIFPSMENICLLYGGRSLR